MKKSYLSYPGMCFLMVMMIMFSSCGKKYGCYGFNFSGSIDHETLYHPNVAANSTTTNPFGKTYKEWETPHPQHSIPPNP